MHLPPFAIFLEEHAVLPSIGDENDFYTEIWKTFSATRDALRDFGIRRIEDLDAGHVRIQVISSLPGMAGGNSSGCRTANDEQASHVAESSGRFVGFAALPMSKPEEASAELRRAVLECGFVGAMIENHPLDGTHYDDKKFWQVFETAQELDVPIYIHPAPATTSSMHMRFSGAFPQVVSTGIANGVWGWHEDVGLHIVKLFAAGLFKHLPRLKIIIGHLGEMLPMMLDRIDGSRFFAQGEVGRFSEVWDRNIWITSSGMFSIRTLEMLLKVTRKERVMYSVDTPLNKSVRGWQFIEQVGEKGVFTDEELDGFAFGNAARLLKLDVEKA